MFGHVGIQVKPTRPFARLPHGRDPLNTAQDRPRWRL